MDLSTTYLGMRLPHPLIVGAGPLGDELDRVRQLEDAGAALIVLRSLYEEEIVGEQMEDFIAYESYSDSFAEAGSFAPTFRPLKKLTWPSVRIENGPGGLPSIPSGNFGSAR